VACGWCALACLASARAGAEALPRFTRLSVEHGLSQATVQAILQDHAGFFWFGTDEGLNRFDGYSFRVFKHDPDDPRSLPHSMISALHEDREKRLWVGTHNGLALFDPVTETFTRTGPVEERVTSILEDAAGTMWIGTVGQGLFRRDAGSGTFVSYAHDPGRPASLASQLVSALHRDRRGRLWVGTRDAGLDMLGETAVSDPAGRAGFLHHRHDPRDPRSLPHDDVLGLGEDRAGTLWIATNGGGLASLDPETGTFVRHPGSGEASGAELMTRILIDRQDVLWVGTASGLQRYDRATGRFVTHRHDPADSRSLSRNTIRSLYEDAAGQLWVGTYDGGADVWSRRDAPFRYYTHRNADPSGLAERVVSSLLEDDRGRIWVGTSGGWLHEFEPRSGTFRRYRVPGARAHTAVLSLAQDRRGRIWAGTYRDGLAQFDPERGTFTVLDHRPDGARASVADSIWAIEEARDGTLWLGTNTGLVQFDPERRRAVLHHETPTPGGLSYTGVRALLHDREGNLWVGTLGGLNVLLRGKGVVRYRQEERDPESLSRNAVLALREDGQGRIWAGTMGGGVNVLDQASGKFKAYFRGLQSPVVYRMEEDADGRLWLSTNRGLSRLDPANGRIENFDLTSGLETVQFQVGASLRTRAGRLLFGSTDGFYEFDPRDVRPDTYAPPVVLTYLVPIADPEPRPVPLSTRRELLLPAGTHAFSVEFAALDRTVPRRNQYAYRMQGLRDEWVPLGARREVTFTNLASGRYVFGVRASNNDGVWGPRSEASLAIVIAPPFWRTWWFRGLVALVALGTLALAYRLRVRRRLAAAEERARAERAVRHSEWQYRSIFDQVTQGVFQSTVDGRFLAANPALARMFGYNSPEALLGEVTDIETQIFVRPSRRQEMGRLLQAFGEVHDFQFEARRRGGGTLWVSANIRALPDDAGNLVYLGTAEDISDRKKAEETEGALRAVLENATQEWQRTFDAIEAYIFILDQGGTVMRINRAVRDGAGRASYQECLGRNVEELGGGEPWHTAHELARAVAYTGAASHARVQDPGSGHTWELRATPVRAADTDAPRTIVVARAVDDRPETERSLVRGRAGP
jgi:PAS domain S-box-containing protein